MAELIGKGTSKDTAFVEMQFIENLGVVRKTFIFFILTPIEAKTYGCAFFFSNKALTEREKDLMTNELHTSTEARKQLAEIRNGIKGMKTSKRSAFSFIVFFNSSINKERKRVTEHLH